MNTKTSFFNKSIFLKNMKRLLPFMLLFALFMFFMEYQSIKDTIQVASYEKIPVSSLKDTINYDLMDISCIIFVKFILTCYSFLVGILMFYYLYQKKLCTTMHALPVTRTCLYLTNVISGLLGILLPLLAVALILGIYLLANGLGVAILFAWIGLVFGYCLIFYALAILTAMITGHLLASPIIYLILNFGIIAAQAIIYLFASIFYYGLAENIDSMPTIFSPFVHLAHHMHAKDLGMTHPDALVDSSRKGIYALIIYAVTAVVILAIAFVLYRKRRLETFSDPIVTKKLQPVFLYAGTAFGGAICAFLLFSLTSPVLNSPRQQDLIALVCFFLLSGIVVYFIISMLLKKTVHVFRSGYKGILVYTVLASAFLFAAHLDVLGIEEKKPEKAEISSVTLSYEYSYTCNITDQEEIAEVLKIHKDILKNKDTLCAELADNSYSWSTISISYQLKNNRKLNRTYYIPYNFEESETQVSEAAQQIQQNVKKFFADPDTIQKKLVEAQPYLDSYTINLPYQSDEEQPVYYSDWKSSKEDLALLEAVKKDIAAGVLKYDFYDEPGTDDTKYFLSFMSYDLSIADYSFVVTKDCTNTLEVIQSLIETYGPTGPDSD